MEEIDGDEDEYEVEYELEEGEYGEYDEGWFFLHLISFWVVIPDISVTLDIP